MDILLYCQLTYTAYSSFKQTKITIYLNENNDCDLICRLIKLLTNLNLKNTYMYYIYLIFYYLIIF